MGFRSPHEVVGVVEWFDQEHGWGVLTSPDLPDTCFVHVSNIQVDGYRYLTEGQDVRFSYEKPGFLQDGCVYRSIKVWPVA